MDARMTLVLVFLVVGSLWYKADVDRLHYKSGHAPPDNWTTRLYLRVTAAASTEPATRPVAAPADQITGKEAP